MDDFIAVAELRNLMSLKKLLEENETITPAMFKQAAGVNSRMRAYQLMQSYVKHGYITKSVTLFGVYTRANLSMLEDDVKRKVASKVDSSNMSVQGSAIPGFSVAGFRLDCPRCHGTGELDDEHPCVCDVVSDEQWKEQKEQWLDSTKSTA